MSQRLGGALAEHIKNMSGGSKFVLVEGVPSSLALGMVAAWTHELPPLAVVSDTPHRFGAHALDGSGTGLRNRYRQGIVLVLCEGLQVPDRSGLNLFENVAPGVLLDSPEGLVRLARQVPAASLDGPVRAVRDAITRAGIAHKPSAAQVAAYFDRVATGDDPLVCLPALGAFADTATGDRVDADRIGDNLALAARRTSDDVLRPTAYAEIRRRAESVLGRRPGLRDDPAGAKAAASSVMTLLQSGSEQLLHRLQFDEAREILEQRTQDLADTALRALRDYQRTHGGGQVADLPWPQYQSRAEDLRHAAQQREAARELLDLDDAQARGIFDKTTRVKLEKLLRDKAVSGSNPSCPEYALIKAVQQLGGPLKRIQVLNPKPPSGTGRVNRSGAVRCITLGCARLRLGGLMHQLESRGVDVDGLLLQPADNDTAVESFHDADLPSGELALMQLRLHGADGNTVQVDWRPDLDDAALLRAALLFAEHPTLALATPQEPTLSSFCGDAPASAVPAPSQLKPLAQELYDLARLSLREGLTPQHLRRWAASWNAVCNAEATQGGPAAAEALSLAGAVTGLNHSVALTGFAPMKAEWLSQYLEALWSLLQEAPDASGDKPVTATAASIARTTASHHPAHIRVRLRDRALLPTSEGRLWSLYGGADTRDESGYAGAALTSVIVRLLTLQPEAAGHLRCLAYGPGAADLLVSQAVKLIGRRTGRGTIAKIEVFCVGQEASDKPHWRTLARADEELRDSRDVLELRYLDSLDRAREVLQQPGSGSPAVHLALVTGISDGGNRLQIEFPEVVPPRQDSEVLFAPRTSQRPQKDRRMLLMPPAATSAGITWLKLQTAVEDAWPADGDKIPVPEVRTGAMDIAEQLRQVHELALWVATLDRYATRDSLEQALGADRIAILHQERRLGGDSPLSLVLSQKSGGPADRAIGRSLRTAGIVSDRDVALSVGADLRRVASQGYGILALEAATSGTGINELVGHVVAFSLLATTTTPWPLPPGCRVLLVSLDEYRHWFPSRRADLLAIALDPAEGGVHVAAIEVKARRSDETDAAAGALDQLNQTLAATQWAAYPVPESIHSRLWLNRIAEAAYSVARESRFRLDARELAALEEFRTGTGTLEWAGVGLVFGPKVDVFDRYYPQQVAGDIVPVVLHSIKLTEALLQRATEVRITDLRTVEADRPPLKGGRTRRRPEAKPALRTEQAADAAREAPSTQEPRREETSAPRVATAHAATPKQEPEPASMQPAPTDSQQQTDSASAVTERARPFQAPILGWDASTGEEVRWHPAGPEQGVLQNGHVEVWGSSGMGKTQFTMSLLAQLAHHSGSKFGIADFKNDYSDETDFPQLAGAKFLDLWNDGAPYNPLALDDFTDRAVNTAVIELRDTVEVATKTFTRIGVRQRAKLEKALRSAYAVGRSEGRWPTLKLLDDELDADLAGVIGDLTHNELFRDGPPLGEVIDQSVVFGLSRIPGNGQTTVLAAGFILSALLLRVQSLPPVPNSVRYIVVVDEAHRVAAFKAVDTMIREGRSKGLGVILATQQPGDLPDVVATNAQTKVCFRLPDATVAAVAARKLNPADSRLAEQIRTLGKGEALVSFGGTRPRLLRMAQAYRDRQELGLPSEETTG
ncbi:helicase HerA-like domain-containing protein [Micromonospora wenchangensis]|uniref:helicase HerA-like domain-containing protein n=1 Tax=Micromonospora wenchangensis TaxID=1185415 RepID=UPI0033BFEF75